MKLEELLDSSPNSHSGCGPLRGTHGRAHIIVRLGRLGRTLPVAVGRGGARGVEAHPKLHIKLSYAFIVTH